MEYYGDNVVSTFGMDQNPGSMVARAIRTAASIGTTWARNEQFRLQDMYGDPTVESVYVSSETSFDMICDDLVANGWYLFDWGANGTSVDGTEPVSEDDPYHVRFSSQHQPEAHASVRLLGCEVIKFVSEMETSGCWFLNSITKAKVSQ